MELTVSPDDLHAAAVAVDGCAHRLESARADFVSVSVGVIPDLGPHAAATAEGASQAAAQATEVVADDIRHLAAALRVLAQVYERLDATAVPR
jgi:hypothetical protein